MLKLEYIVLKTIPKKDFEIFWVACPGHRFCNHFGFFYPRLEEKAIGLHFTFQDEEKRDGRNVWFRLVKDLVNINQDFSSLRSQTKKTLGCSSDAITWVLDDLSIIN